MGFHHVNPDRHGDRVTGKYVVLENKNRFVRGLRRGHARCVDDQLAVFKGHEGFGFNGCPRHLRVKRSAVAHFLTALHFDANRLAGGVRRQRPSHSLKKPHSMAAR